MHEKAPFLFPRPREVALHGDFLNLPEQVLVFLPENADARLVDAVAELSREEPRLTLTRSTADRPVIRIDPMAEKFPTEGYEIEILEADCVIRASDSTGVFYALGVLRQLIRQNPRALPRLVIADAPALEERGFMLDVSRTKLPKLSTLLRFVPFLAALRINRLQLYIEHTFAFPGHETVWRESGALTGDDIRILDAHCRAHFITLVPNLNGFGHFERWLKHPAYAHLAESPDGFVHPVDGSERGPGTLKPDRESLDFLASLYDAYLPHFSSTEFNAGGDEPWELGLGRSKAECEREGKQTVYLRHMAGLHALCVERGVRMQFWADILLEHPGRAGEAPPDAVPIIWGYDAGHPFDAQCSTLKKLGRRFLVAPGASSWNSFSTRKENAFANIDEAITAAGKHGAAGILMTCWGDNGNHWPWPVMYPALARAAALAWSIPANASTDVFSGLDALLFRDGGASVAALAAFLDTDAIMPKRIGNKSPLWEILFAPEKKRADALAGVSPENLRKTLAHLDRVDALLDAVPTNSDKGSFVPELRVGVGLSRIAARVGLVELGEADSALATDFEKMIFDYEAAWRLRAVEGGLAESAAALHASAARIA